MTTSRRILVLATAVLAAAAGCQKAQQAEVPKNDASRSGAAHSNGEGSRAAAGKGGETKSATGGAKGASAPKAAAGTKAFESSGSPKGGATLREPDDGKYVDLKPGNVIHVKLASNHAAGYSWSMADSSGTVLVHDAGPVYTLNPPSKKGGKSDGGTETWRFRAVRSGQQTMRLVYGRPWENIPTRTFRFTAVVSY